MGKSSNRNFHVDVDFVLKDPEELRSKQGQLSVQGEPRKKLEEYKLSSRVLEEHGPGGGNPLVRLYGARRNLIKFLNEVFLDDGAYVANIQVTQYLHGRIVQ